MSNVIDVVIRNKIATASDERYICGNSDYLIRFDFDAEWDPLITKTARFINGEEEHDVVFSGSECPVPTFANATRLMVGVYAGNLHTTAPAYIHTRKSILCDSGAPIDPPDDVYHQIMTEINEIHKAIPDAEVSRKAAEEAAANAAKSAENAAQIESQVNKKGVEAINAVKAQETQSIEAVLTECATRIDAVRDEGESQINAVNEASATLEQKIEQKGAEVLSSIPEDYTALTEHVGQFTEDMDNKMDKYILSVNRLSSEGAQLGVAINTNTGEVYENEYTPAFRVSDYCDVATQNPYGTVTVRGLSSARICFYDSTKTYISGIDTEDVIHGDPLTLPDGARYVRVQSTRDFSNALINIGSDTEYHDPGKTAVVIPTKTSELENDSDYVTQKQVNDVAFVYKSDNLFDPDNETMIITGYALSASGILTINADYNVLKIPVEDLRASYNLYIVNSTGTTWQRYPTRIAMYDEKHQLLGILVNGTTESALITNEKCRYLYANITTANFAKVPPAMFIRNGGEKYNSYIPCETVRRIKSSLYGKNVLAYGDSITAINHKRDKNVGWIRYINKEYGIGDFFGRGVGGQRYIWNESTFRVDDDGAYVDRGTESDNCKGCFCSWERISKMIPDDIKDSIDLILLMGGTNDLTATTIEYAEPVWSAEHVTDTDWVAAEEYNGGDYDVSTFCGGIASTIMKLQTRCPNARIVVITPLSRWSGYHQYESKGTNTMDVADVEIRVARYMAMPYIDVNGTTGINGYNYTKYITDGVHPYNDAGQQALANAIIGGLRTLFID